MFVGTELKFDLYYKNTIHDVPWQLHNFNDIEQSDFSLHTILNVTFEIIKIFPSSDFICSHGFEFIGIRLWI